VLVAHQAGWFSARGPMKMKPLCSNALGEVGFSERKAVAGMDRLGVGDFGGADYQPGCSDSWSVARGRPDAHRFVRELDVLGLTVGRGVQGHGADAEGAAGALDTQRNFAAVGDNHFSIMVIR